MVRQLVSACTITASLAFLPAVALANTCPTATSETIKNRFNVWNTALATGNPESVARLYAPDAVLLPTVSNGPLRGREAIQGYFVDFLKKSPRGTINESVVKIDCNTATDKGTYTFQLTGEDGKTTQVQARYTYVYRFTDGEWLIEHHHSSAFPATASAPRK